MSEPLAIKRICVVHDYLVTNYPDSWCPAYDPDSGTRCNVRTFVLLPVEVP